MTPIPPIPTVDEAPSSLFDGGHLWIQELVDGERFVFHMDETGVIDFEFDDRAVTSGSIPWPVRSAVRHVRERFERDRFRAAVDGVTDYRFVAVATIGRSIDYEWDRLPPVLGMELWRRGDSRPLAPDVVEKIFAELGLRPVNAFQKEVRAVDFDPKRHPMPQSNWYDGPAYGVIIRNKTGDRANWRTPSDGTVETEVADGPEPETLAEELVTRRRFERIVAYLRGSNRHPTVDDVFERMLETIARETAHDIFADTEDERFRSFRTVVVRRVERFLDERQ